MSTLADLRKSYERAELDESTSLADPLAQFGLWLEQAIQAQVPEPNAMTLATVSENGRPATRIVLIKSFDANGIVWYTNYQSRKGRELEANPYAALQFHWLELERVVRIEGRVERVSEAESDAYFHTRPLDSRLGAWASPQSEVIASRAVLVANVAKVALRYALNPPHAAAVDRSPAPQALTAPAARAARGRRAGPQGGGSAGGRAGAICGLAKTRRSRAPAGSRPSAAGAAG
jgi:pyridoxamine 5'-phosphate oxidase